MVPAFVNSYNCSFVISKTNDGDDSDIQFVGAGLPDAHVPTHGGIASHGGPYFVSFN